MGLLAYLRGGHSLSADEELDRNVEEEIARNLWVRHCRLCDHLHFQCPCPREPVVQRACLRVP